MTMLPRFTLFTVLLLIADEASFASGFVESPHVPARPSFVAVASAGTERSQVKGSKRHIEPLASSFLNLEGLHGNVELPDFGHLFDRIKEVSPLARQALTGESAADKKGLAAVDDKDDRLQWKKLERNPKGSVLSIDKIDNFDGKNAPILRFRSSLQGPIMSGASLLGNVFGRYIIDLDERKKWDTQIEQVYELQQISNLEIANEALGLGRFGECSRMGIGYGQTKKALGITPREQLFLYGLQDLPDGSCLLWGTEMDEKFNHLLPGAQRHTRAKSHLFSATLVPTGHDTFDIEYVLQLSIGGNVPTWLTTPVMVDTVKSLFKVAEKEFKVFSEEISKNVDGFLTGLFKDQNDDPLIPSLLMTP